MKPEFTPFTEVSPNFWTAADAQMLGLFLDSQAGEKFKILVKNEICGANERAVNEFRGDHFECGRASGFKWFSTCLDYFRQFSAQPEESPTSTTEGQDGAPDILERYAP